MKNTEPAKFEVTDHFFMKERGGFVIGLIRSGTFRIGMLVPTDLDGGTLTISGIEFLDNTKTKTFLNALVFLEKPSIEYLRRHLPVDSVITAKNPTEK